MTYEVVCVTIYPCSQGTFTGIRTELSCGVRATRAAATKLADKWKAADRTTSSYIVRPVAA